MRSSSSSSSSAIASAIAAMDSIFLLEDGDRAAFLEQMMQAFGCVYVCLKYYVPAPHNCLRGLDGIYHERSTSQRSLARRLFEVYRESSSYPDTGLIPGLAFTSNNPCMKLELHEFQTLVSSDFQLQFYQEAGIKTVVLMGCATGEIELGMSHPHHHPQPQVDLEMEMKNLIRINFPHLTDPNQPYSSSSSSLLSVDSPEYPPLFNNINPTVSRPFVPTTTTTTTTPHDQAVQALNQIRNAQLIPTIESEEDTMTKAILAVLSSPSTSSPNVAHQRSQTLPTAFTRYNNPAPPRIAAVNRKHSQFKRAVLFFRSLNINLRSRAAQESHSHSYRPSATQMHHMISERRRREKLNDSYNILRSLLPPGSKKDKASVLSSSTEYLSSLKSQVAELTKRNQILESHLNSLQKSEIRTDGSSVSATSSSTSGDQRVNVEIVQVSPEERLMELRVRVRGGISMLDLVIRVIELLKRQCNVMSLSSVESNTRVLGSVAVHAVIIRFRVHEGDEFEEDGFVEGVRRVVDDQTN